MCVQSPNVLDGTQKYVLIMMASLVVTFIAQHASCRLRVVDRVVWDHSRVSTETSTGSVVIFKLIDRESFSGLYAAAEYHQSRLLSMLLRMKEMKGRDHGSWVHLSGWLMTTKFWKEGLLQRMELLRLLFGSSNASNCTHGCFWFFAEKEKKVAGQGLA